MLVHQRVNPNVISHFLDQGPVETENTPIAAQNAAPPAQHMQTADRTLWPDW